MTQGRKNQGHAKPLADIATRILSPVIEQRAGMSMDIVASWPDIAGEPFGTHSTPEKLVWPNRSDDDEPFEPALLILRCDAARILFLQHETTAIIERVNTYFGFGAVGRVKLVRRDENVNPTRSPQAGKPEMSERSNERLNDILRQVEDDGLRATLHKLGKGVFSSPS